MPEKSEYDELLTHLVRQGAYFSFVEQNRMHIKQVFEKYGNPLKVYGEGNFITLNYEISGERFTVQYKQDEIKFLQPKFQVQ